jgi:hypothetical protein
MTKRFDLRREWLFAGLLAAFCLIYALWYPATISIEDESSNIALAYSIEHGSIYTEAAGQLWGLPIGIHNVSKFSPFHAALLVPAIALNWKLVFLVSAGFFIAGAFILRAMLLRDGLGSGWTALYFLLPGALYYSQTAMAGVPAAVMALLGVSLCLRNPPRPLLAGLAFGASVLLHPWMGPIVIIFCGIWIFEQRFSGMLELILGAIPSILLLAAYNFATTGNPIRNVYTILGHQHLFRGEHLVGFLTFYVASIAIFPLSGWSAFSRRWSGTYAVPAVGAVVVAMASLYYYRDGLNFGSARVPGGMAAIAGLVPGQRFLLPFSMIACFPAARFLNSRFTTWDSARLTTGKVAALLTFVVGFSMLSIFHQAYLTAFATIQQAIQQNISPEASVAIDPQLAKDFAPLPSVYRYVTVLDETDAPAPEAYIALLLPPGQSPPVRMMENRASREIMVRSWVWNRDLLILLPAHPKD